MVEKVSEKMQLSKVQIGKRLTLGGQRLVISAAPWAPSPCLTFPRAASALPTTVTAGEER